MKLLICTQAVDRDDPILGFFHRWLLEFARRCEQVTVICLREGKHSLPQNVSVYSLDVDSTEKKKNTMIYHNIFRRMLSRVGRSRKFWCLCSMLRRDYDAVFVHMNPEYVILGAPLWRCLGKRVGLWYVHRAVTLRLRVATLLAHHVLTASPSSFRLKTRKLSVVGHGIDTELFVPKAPGLHDPLHVVTAGRVAKTKQLNLMFDALSLLHERGRRFIFTIIGAPVTVRDVSYEKELKRRSAALREDTVRWEGPVAYEKLPALLREQDVFLNLSRTGSLDKAVLDALAAGVPVVTGNEAFAGGATPVRYVASPTPDAVTAAIEAECAAPRDPVALHTWVKREHGLSRCIERILASYRTEVS